MNFWVGNGYCVWVINTAGWDTISDDDEAMLADWDCEEDEEKEEEDVVIIGCRRSSRIEKSRSRVIIFHTT